MVKLVSAAAVILATAISAVQADFVLSKGQLPGTHAVSGVNCVAASLSYTKAKNTLKAGQVFCSFLPKVGMTLCQCHQSDATADGQNGFIADILNNAWLLGTCSDKKGGITYANAGTWISGYYHGNNYVSTAGYSNGKVSSSGCSAVGCSSPSQELSWRDLKTVSTTC
ncbi:hypothetical protein BGZ83_002327 [Gryganskiella cystojenkinii]|nr:hypothetical protein BGZ83_002327 [Gryganskiella cystojenkinii]